MYGKFILLNKLPNWFTKWLSFYIFIRNVWGLQVFYILATLGIEYLLIVILWVYYYSLSRGCVAHLIVVLIWISLKNKGAEHLFMNLSLSHTGKMSIQIFCIFFLLSVLFNFYNIVLVSAIQQHKTAISIHIPPPSWDSLPPIPPLRSWQSARLGFLCYIASSHQLSILDM